MTTSCFLRCNLIRVAIVAAIAGMAAQAPAADKDWVGGTDNWSSSNDWSPTGQPGATDDVYIDHGDTGTNSVVSVDVAANAKDLTIDLGDTLGINDGRSLNIYGTSVLNNGALNINSSGGNTYLYIRNANTTFSGSGTLTLSDDSNNYVRGGATSDVLTNTANHTIQGSGHLGNNQMGLDNQGLILATNAGNALEIDLVGTAGVTRSNSGTLRADGGQLTISGTDLSNSGLIEARNASTVLLSGSTIEGGTLHTEGSGVINMQGSAKLKDLTIDSQVVLLNNNTGYLQGSIANAGDIKVNSTGVNTWLRIDGDTTLNGTGTLTLSDDSHNYVLGVATSDVLTNTADHTIQGSGGLGHNLMGLDNQGTVIANNAANALTIDLVGTGGVTRSNSGTLRADGGQLSIVGTVLSNSGLIEARDGSTVLLSNSTIDGGTLHTEGTGVINMQGTTSRLKDLSIDSQVVLLDNNIGYLEGTITNAGDIRLDSSGGNTDLYIAGDVTLDGNGTLTLSDNVANQVRGTATSNVLTNTANHTIQGAGKLGGAPAGEQIGLDNRGTIIANQSAGLYINLTDTAGVTRSNSGTMKADGGLLSIQGTDLNNTGGVIAARNGSNVEFNNSTITGGTLATDPGSEIQLINDTRLVNLTNHGPVKVPELMPRGGVA